MVCVNIPKLKKKKISTYYGPKFLFIVLSYYGPARGHIGYFSSSCDNIAAQGNLRKVGLRSWQQETEEAGGAVSSSRKHWVVNASFPSPESFLLSPGTLTVKVTFHLV